MTPTEVPHLAELIDLVEQQANGGSDLDCITLAESVSYDLGQMADQLTDHFVQKARAAGHSWAEIGKQLGMSKQGAQQRYIATGQESNEALIGQMLALELPAQGDPSRAQSVRKTLKKVKEALHFQRFNDGALQVVVGAQMQARELRHPYIGSEHLLLALLAAEDNSAKKALAALGVTVESSRPKILEELGTGTASGSGHMPFKKEAKIALELALRESIRLGHDYIGSEHVLLGLVRADNRAVALLKGLGATKDQIVEQVDGLFEKP
ncbi:MAG: Clp protease N-terminal domain-containing protein [Actinomycetota bacterium]